MEKYPKSMRHFGVTIKPGTLGPKMTRENYAVISTKVTDGKLFQEKDNYKRSVGYHVDRLSAVDEFEGRKYQIYADESCLFYTDEWTQMHKQRCLMNYDLNLKFYSYLDTAKFENEIEEFINKFTNFIEVFDLNDYDKITGNYLLVLGNYNQVYIGGTNNLKRRIMQHWSKKKEFDRLLFPPGNKGIDISRLSIDSFRALDTTQIFVFPSKFYFEQEDEFKRYFSDEFVVNRIMGGSLEDKIKTFEAIADIKARKLK